MSFVSLEALEPEMDLITLNQTSLPHLGTDIYLANHKRRSASKRTDGLVLWKRQGKACAA